MIDEPTILERLIRAAEWAVLPGRVAPMNPRELDALRATVMDPHRPIPEGGTLITDRAALMVRIVDLVLKARAVHHDDQQLYSQLAGVLLPSIRQDFSEAIERRRNTRPTP